MIIDIDETKVRCFHDTHDTEPFKVLDIIDLVIFWEEHHEETTIEQSI